MRILIATPHRNVVGGVEKYLQDLLPSLVQRGHELALLYEFPWNPAAERIDGLNLSLPAVGIREAGRTSGMQFVRDFAPDIVYSQSMEDAEFQSALLAQYPTVFYAHNYIGTCASGQKCHAFPSAQPCHRRFGPACLALYYPRRCGGLNPVTMWKLYERSAERNKQLAKYAAILVASEHMRREYLRHGVAPGSIHLAPLPNPNESQPGPAERRSETPSRILFLGRLTKLKGVADLLESVPLAEKWLAEKRQGCRLTVTIAGDGPEQERLQALARRNGIQAEFTGWIGSSRKSELMQQVDLLAVPSLWPEPFGLVGIEAGAFGVPAVAYDVGGISDWLISGYSGELAPGNPPSATGLAEAIVRALIDPSHYLDLSNGAREVAARFTLARHVSQIESTFETILRAARPTANGLTTRKETANARA